MNTLFISKNILKKNIKISLYIITRIYLNSSIILAEVLSAFKQVMSFKKILNRLKRYILENIKDLGGFKIVIKGRYSRRTKASIFKYQIKGMPANTLNARIDYSSGFVKLKYGLCGVKI